MIPFVAFFRSYSQIMKETMLRKDEADLQRQMKEKAKDGTLKAVEQEPAPKPAPKRRGRWDVSGALGAGQDETPAKKIQIDTTPSQAPSKTPEAPKTLQPWDPTPGRRDIGGETPGGGGGGAMTPSVPRMWDPTPAHPSQVILIIQDPYFNPTLRRACENMPSVPEWINGY